MVEAQAHRPRKLPLLHQSRKVFAREPNTDQPQLGVGDQKFFDLFIYLGLVVDISNQPLHRFAPYVEATKRVILGVEPRSVLRAPEGARAADRTQWPVR